MNDDDEKTLARTNGPKITTVDGAPSAPRTTTPAGTPANKIAVQLAPAAFAPPRARPELAEPTTLRGHGMLATQDVAHDPRAADEDDDERTQEQPRPAASSARAGNAADTAPTSRRVSSAIRFAPADDDEETVAREPATVREPSGQPAQGANHVAPSPWTADAKVSPQDLPSAYAPGPTLPGAQRVEAARGEARWSVGFAVGAAAFVIGAILPLPFRRLIVPGLAVAATPPVSLSVASSGPGPSPGSSSVSAPSPEPSAHPSVPPPVVPAVTNAPAMMTATPGPAPSAPGGPAKRPGVPPPSGSAGKSGRTPRDILIF